MTFDEKAFRKGHNYLTVVNDLVRGLYVAEDRKQESLDGFWGTLTQAQREGIEVNSFISWLLVWSITSVGLGRCHGRCIDRVAG
jgi:Transposase